MPGSWTSILVDSLTLDHRLADTELIDAIANGLQRLIDNVIAQRAHFLFDERQEKVRVAGAGFES